MFMGSKVRRSDLAGLLAIVLTLCIAVIPPASGFSPFSNPNQISSPHSREFDNSSDATVGLAFLKGTTTVASLPSLSGLDAMETQTAPSHFSPTGSKHTGPLAAPVSSPASSTISVLSGFEGLNQTISCGCVPPDVIVAAGPSHVVEMVNLAGEVFSKDGAAVRTFPLATFFLTGQDTISDPKVLYDTSSGRWFASIFQWKAGIFVTFNLVIAVSGDSDPTGNWQVYAIKTGTLFPDQPLIGISDDKFTISANMFADNTYVGSQYWILNKKEMVAGNTMIDLGSVGPVAGLESAYPVQSLSSTTKQYLVSVGGEELGTSSSTVKVISVTGLPPGPITVTTMTRTVSTITQPPSASQPGAANLNTNDYRVLSSVFFNGKIWYALTDTCTPPQGSGSRSCVRLTQLNTVGTTVLQDFDLGIKNTDLYFPAVSIDGTGNMVAVYGYSNSTVYPSIAVTGQRTSDPAGSLGQSKTLRAGVSSENSGFSRYGDYFGAATDPSDTNTVWVAGEYITGSATCGSANCWGTFVGSATIASSFRLSASPAYLNVQPGSSVTSTITALSVGGFSGTAALSSVVDPAGPTGSLNPSSVALASEGTATSTLTITTVQTTPPGPYTITVTGINGALNIQVSLKLVVGPDFTATVQPASLSGQAGTTKVSTITLRSVNNLAGTIALSTVVFQSGPTASVSPPSVTLSPGGAGSSTLSVVSPYAGFFTVEVDASFGNINHSVFVGFNVNGFALRANPSGAGISPGSSTSSQITATSLNGFAGKVSLVATVSPPGPTITVLPSSILLTPGSIGTSTLSVSTAGSTASGQYTVTATGTNASESHGVSFTVIVTPVYFTLNDGENFTGVRVTTTVSLSYDSPANVLTLSGTGSVVAVNATTGVAMFSKTYTITKFPVGSQSQFFLWVGVAPNPLTAKVTIGGSTVALTRSIDINRNGLIDLPDLNAVGAGFACSIGSPCYNPRADLNADGTIDVIDLAYVGGNYGSIDYIANYAAASTPGTIVVPKGSSASATISLASTNGFEGTLNLSVASSNTVTASLSPSSIVLSSGGTGSATLTVSSSTLGVFPVNVTATGTISHVILVTVKVADIVETSTRSSVCIVIGQPIAAPSIIVYSANGFAGTVSLSASVTPSGLTATLVQPTLSLTADFANTTIVSLSSSRTGFYTVTVTSTSGALSHTVTISVQVTRNACNV